MKKTALAMLLVSIVTTSTALALSWYNGFSPEERLAKLNVCNEKLEKGEIADASGPCMLCGDPDIPVELHSEDYGKPYLWTYPAVLSLCKTCHRFKLHGRFARPEDWQTYVAHVRRGGYSREIKDPEISKELRAYREALKKGETPNGLCVLRPYTQELGKEWFANLRLDAESKMDPTARPRGPNPPE